MSSSKVLAVFAVGVVAALSACGTGGSGSTSPPPTGSTSDTTGLGDPAQVPMFSDSFATGSINKNEWDTKNATVVTGGGADPAHYAHIVAHNSAAYMNLTSATVPSGLRYFSMRGSFRIESRASGQTVGVATVKNSYGQHHVDLFIDASTGKCRVDIYQNDTALSPGRCDDGKWHDVELKGDYGATTYKLDWILDGTAMPSVQSVSQPVTTVKRLTLGDATTGKTNVLDWATVGFSVSNSALPFLLPVSDG
jgi:hypothetical protein